MRIDGPTASQIESWFVEGDRAADRVADGEGGGPDECPYDDKLAQHWWTEDTPTAHG